MNKTKLMVMLALIGWIGGVGGAELATENVPNPRLSPRPVSVGGVATPCLNLGGEWRFNPAPPVGFGSALDVSAGTNWAAIQVPGQWLQQGFTVDPKTAAGYRRKVAIPADWAGRRVKLRCDGVYSLATIWVNGREIGKHEGGFTPFEFDVTDAVTPGAEAVLSLAVRSTSHADDIGGGSRYACHDLGGIPRKIQLFALPPVNLASLHVEPIFENGFEQATLRVDLVVANDGAASAGALNGRLELRDPRGQPAGTVAFAVPPLAACTTTVVRVSLPVSKPELWDVEHPRLYALTVTLGEGAAIESVSRRVGFRKAEMVDKQFALNGRKLMVRATARHEMDPLRGRSLEGDIWRRDVELLLRGNVNLLRTSHYPPPEELLDICDELGLMVQCEGPFCWAHTKAQPEVVESQLMEMVEACRNHPSVVMWSLGNESQFSAGFKSVATWLRQNGPSIPTMFSYSEGSLDFVDMASHHYPSVDAIKRVAPFNPVGTFFDEYAHLSDSNRRELLSDPGVRDVWGYKLARLWDAMKANPGAIGGAIWVGFDETYFLPGGRPVGYGALGMIDGWRRPKPEYWHMVKVYSPVCLLETQVPLPAAGEPVRLTVENRSDFADLNEMRFNWTLAGVSGESKAQAAPGMKGTLEIPVTGAVAGSELELHVIGPRGFEVDAYSWRLGEGAAVVPPPLRPAGALTLKRTDGEIAILGKDFSYTLDAASGLIKAGTAGGRELPISGPCLTVIPMNAENGGDRQLKGKEPHIEPLWGLCTGWKASAVDARQQGDAVVVVKVSGAYGEAAGDYELTFDGAGRLSVRWSFTSRSDKEIDLRQHGIAFALPKECDTLAWRRRGQWNYYPADHIGRLEGKVRAASGRPFCGWFIGPSERPDWPWSEDWNQYGCNDFRSAKLNILTAMLHDERSLGLRAVAAADRHAHAWMDGDRAFLAVLDYANDGVNEGLAKERRGVPPRVIEPGGVIAGSAQVEMVGGATDAAAAMSFVVPASSERVTVVEPHAVVTVAQADVATPAAPAPGKAPVSSAQSSLVAMVSRDYGIERNMTALEMERIGAVSKVKIIGGAAGDTLFDVLTFCQIAKARGCKYYVVLSAEECGDFSWTYFVGFTNKEKPDMKKEFGAGYSDRDEKGRTRPIVRVADYESRLVVKQ